MKNPHLLALIMFFCGASLLSAQIQPGKAVQITISGVPPEEKARFDPIYPVSESGTINLPFIGQVRAAGLMAEQLASLIQQKYVAAQIYTNPVFQVIDSDAKRIDSQVVYFGGDVRATGPKPYTRNLTLYQALQLAGGQNEFGAVNRVELHRNGQMIIYDLTETENMSVLVQPNDTIIVPRKNIFNR